MERIETLTYSVKELAAVIPCGLPTAYNLCHREDFPAIWIGGKYRIPKKALAEWIENHKGEEFR